MRCPICKKPSENSPANRFRPFCSERCQLIDLGTWAGEGYRVPGAKGRHHVTIVGGGHFLQEDKPQEVARVLDEFIRGSL